MIRDHLGTVIAALVFVALWQALYLFAGGAGLASPAATLQQLWRLMSTATFWDDVAETGRAFAASLVIVVLAGIAIGFSLGLNRTAARVAEPVIVNLYSLPKVTLYPLVLLIFGLGISARVAFGVMHGLIPLCLYTMNAISRMKPVYLRTARALRLPWTSTVTSIVWPAILPEVLTGLRLAFSLSLLGVLIGEMFASPHGLGHLVFVAMDQGDMPTTLAIALLLAIFAAGANTILLTLERTCRR